MLSRFYKGDVDVNATLKRLNGEGGVVIGESPDMFFDDNKTPFSDWRHVYVPYYTGDAHTGNKTMIYGLTSIRAAQMLKLHFSGG